MAYVNVASWNTDQVAEWIKGLSEHEAMQTYARQLQASDVTGAGLLRLRAGDLRQLNISRVGHQEIILAAIARLQSLHYTLNSENLQQLAMRLCSKVRSLYIQLSGVPSTVTSDNQSQPTVTSADQSEAAKQRVTIPILEAVTDAMMSVKDIISWLNTAPFEGQETFTDIKARILEPSVRLVMNAQRDSFAVRPVDGIRAASEQLADVCDDIVRDCPDSLILLPAPLLIMTIKRKPDEPLGLHIVRAISGVHIITGVKFQSPAHVCGKLEEGDEIVQVNYQTVVGWQLGKVIDLLQDKEFGSEVYLTVKKRPKHSNLIDQVYFKPFRLPNKKRTPYRWNTSPRPDLLTSLPRITLAPRLPSPEAAAAELTPHQSSDSDSDAFLPESGADAASPTSVRHYQPKPRPTLQRRATVTGASPTSRRPPASLEQFWRELTRERRVRQGLAVEDSPPLRRHTLSSESDDELPPPRPLTCIPRGGGNGAPARVTVKLSPQTQTEKSAGGSRPSLSSVTTEGVSHEDRVSPCPSGGGDEGDLARDEDDGGDDVGGEGHGRTSVSSLPEPSVSVSDKPRLEKTQSAPAYDLNQRDESFERVLRQLPRANAIQEESDPESPLEAGPGFETTTTSPSVPSAGSATAESSAAASAPLPVTPDLITPAAIGAPDTGEAAGAPAPSPSTTPHCTAAAQSTVHVTEEYASISLPAAPSTATVPDTSSASVTNFAPGTTTLQLDGVTQDSSSTDMPAPVRDARDPSALREIIEAMDVAFRGLKTSLSDLSRAEASPGSPSEGSNSATMLRHQARLSFKGRRVSCKDLGQGDCHGWLHVKKEGRGFLHHDKWAKRWLVLHEHVLYSYRNKEAQEAETLISLPGYQVSPATDVRSKKYAFRVHSNDRSMVFASDSQLDMTKWMNKMGLSAIAYASPQSYTTGGFCRPDTELTSIENMHFSDTEDEDDRRKSPLKTAAISPSPSSSLERARRKLKSWRAASPAPSVGSVSSLSSLGSEKPQVHKKPSLRFLSRVRRDTGGSPVSEGSQGSPRRPSHPETAPGQRGATSPRATTSSPSARGTGMVSVGSSSTPLQTSASSHHQKSDADPLAFVSHAKNRVTGGDYMSSGAQEAIVSQKNAVNSEEYNRQPLIGSESGSIDRDLTPTPQTENIVSSPTLEATDRGITSPRDSAATTPSARPSLVRVAEPAPRSCPPLRPASSGAVSVTARWLESPQQVTTPASRRPLSQPGSGGPRQRPVPPPRRPRSKDTPPEYVNWRVPPPASALPPPLTIASRQTETVIKIGGGGRVERIEERERRVSPQKESRAPPAVESRRLSVQHHRGVTAEGRAVANILSGTHTVPYRRVAAVDPDRLPGYMRPTISASRRYQDTEARREAQVVTSPALNKQRSISTSRLSPLPPISGGRVRRTSLTPSGTESPTRRLSVDSGSLPRKPVLPARPRVLPDVRGVRVRSRALSEEPVVCTESSVPSNNGGAFRRAVLASSGDVMRGEGPSLEEHTEKGDGAAIEEASLRGGDDHVVDMFDADDDSVFVESADIRTTSSNDTLTEEGQDVENDPADKAEESSSSSANALSDASAAHNPIYTSAGVSTVLPPEAAVTSTSPYSSSASLLPKLVERKQQAVVSVPGRGSAAVENASTQATVPDRQAGGNSPRSQAEPQSCTQTVSSPPVGNMLPSSVEMVSATSGIPQLRNISQPGAETAPHTTRVSDPTNGSPQLRNFSTNAPHNRTLSHDSANSLHRTGRPPHHPAFTCVPLAAARPPLKKTSQYECPSWSPMARHAEDARWRLAFEMSLDGGGGERLAEAARPRVPPRLAKSASASQVGILQPASGVGRVKPNISIQVPPDTVSGEGEPRTPLKPAMGVAMIGKQRRTPSATSPSPQFVFPAAAPGPLSPPQLSSGYGSLSASQHTLSDADSSALLLNPLQPPCPVPLSKSATSPQLGWGFRVLPRYGLQYPPTFTPDTYSLAQLSQSQSQQVGGATPAVAAAAAAGPPHNARLELPLTPRMVADTGTQTGTPPGEAGGS